MNKTFKTTVAFALTFALITFSFAGPFSAVPVTVSAQSGSEWSFRVVGAVSQPLDISMSDLTVMPKTVVNAELYCEGRFVGVADWGGVKLDYILDLAGVNYAAANIDFYASDGYHVNVGITPELKQQIIAYEFDNTPLQSPKLILPGWPGSYWIGLITEIDVTLPGIIVTPQPTQTPSPTPTIHSTPPPTPAPTLQPTVTPTPTAIPTQTPSPTPAPTATETPQTTRSVQPTQTAQPTPTNTQSPPTAPPSPQQQNQTTPTPAPSGLSNQQEEPEATPSASTGNYNYLLIVVAVAAVVAAGILIFRHTKNSRVPQRH
ncbi:MAG: molybdopterin-dependent oxidoreductase [Candidatus Bathyarchaeota archaeon]|nr:molybdopterin-dependent oxidoreductase [Candidatus Bathyarchaeota archaeon]